MFKGLLTEGERLMSRLIEKMTPDYLQDVLVRLAHHSSAIEGNTITLPETVTIILNNTMPGNENISRREFYEVVNHEEAFEYVLDMINNDEKLSISIIKDIHEKLTDRLQHDKGKFKIVDNYIKGADFSTASPERVPQLIEQLIGNLDYRIENSNSEGEILKAILETHIKFEIIHPFSDGNGRTGRMVMNYSLLENNLPPLIIKGEHKNEYIKILAQATELPSEDDVNRFVAFAKPIMEEERKRMIAFSNKEMNQITDIVETKEEGRKRKEQMKFLKGRNNNNHEI